jgi:hypothetical protein
MKFSTYNLQKNWKKKWFILLFEMLGYPKNINGDGYIAILKSNIRFFYFILLYLKDVTIEFFKIIQITRIDG